MGVLGILLYFLFFYLNYKNYRLKFLRSRDYAYAIMIGMIAGIMFFAYFKGGMIRRDGVFEIPMLIGFFSNYIEKEYSKYEE